MARGSSALHKKPASEQLHGRQRGKKLRAVQSGLVRDLLPRLALPAGKEPLDPASLFDFSPAELVMEIGFGGGEHLADEAAGHPDTGYIGCEPFVNGVAKLLARVETDGLGNIRVHNGNALHALSRLPDASLARIDLLYPDPWPKWRHRKRRFVSMESLASMARVIRPGGALHFATDIDDYAGWMLARARLIPAFRWRAEKSSDWLTPWEGWRPTRYEEKARREGRKSVYLTFERL